MCTILENFANESYRKLSSFSHNSADQNGNLKISPTKSEDYTISKVDDYGSKGSITGWISEIGRLP